MSHINLVVKGTYEQAKGSAARHKIDVKPVAYSPQWHETTCRCGGECIAKVYDWYDESNYDNEIGTLLLFSEIVS